MALAPTALSRVQGRRWAIAVAARGAGLLLLLLGLAVLIGGYGFDVAALRRVFPGLASMKPNTALAFALAGGALALGPAEGGWRRWVAVGAGAVVLVIGGVTLAEYLFAVQLGIDELLVRDPAYTQTYHPGRMSPLGAVNLVLAGLALLLQRIPGPLASGATQGLGAAVLALSLVALAGYAYDVQPLYRVAFYTSMALLSAIGSGLLGVGLVLARRDAWPACAFAEESAQGRILRHLLPLAALAPLVLGAATYGGVDADVYDAPFALALFTLVSGALLAAVVLRTAAVIGRAEEAREAERRWLETTLASIGDGVIATDPQGRVVLINRVAADLTGEDPAGTVGRALGEVLRLVDEETGAPTADPVGRVLREGKTVNLRRAALLRPDGQRIPIDDSAAPIRDASRVVGAVLVFRDVRARRAAASALSESEASFRALFETAGVGTAVLDPKTAALQRANRKLCAMVGRESAALIGAPYFDLVHGDDAAAVRALHDHVLRGDAPEGQIEARCRRADGSSFWAITTFTALRGARGLVRRVVAVVHDVDDLKRYQQEAEEAARHKDQFLAMLGHELRNPLAALRNAAELQQRMAPSDPRHTWAQGVVVRQTRHMGRVIDDLLDVTRIGRGVLRLQREPVDIAALLAHVASDQSPAAERQGVSVRLEAPSEPVWVDGDPARLYQVIDNLLGNAIKFTEAGGEVTGSVAAAGDQAVVRVRDTGAGIDAAQLPVLFDAFQQAAQSLDRPRGGLGLGLALVKGLTELHGGSVSARSEGLGRGAEFEVRLPLRSALVADAAEPAPSAAAARRVLVVEDNPDVAESLRTLLHLEGHEVRLAHDGETALQEALRSPPEVVLCDIGLPGELTGYDVARRFRREPALRGAHLVAVTGYGGPEDRERARTSGFDQVLVKPVGVDEVEEALRGANNRAA